MARPRALITGFGPFPGAPENPSAWLAEALCDTRPRGRELLHAEVLPTEWEAVAALAPRLYASLQPHAMIHFGLCQRAVGFRIERSAYNRIAPRADARAALPATRLVLAEGVDRLDTRVPAARLAAHLSKQGLPAASSRSAGRYLCNFLYYHSLAWASRQETPPVALFVHIPRTVAQGGALSDTALLHGAQEVLRFVLAFADTRTLNSPLEGEVDRSLIGRDEGEPSAQRAQPTPLPTPPPQGGREFIPTASEE
jgi:pyroglutamyl-peptidase